MAVLRDTTIVGSITISGKLFATSKAVATANEYGLIKVGYSENGRNFPVELDTNGKAFVNVPAPASVNNARITLKQRNNVIGTFTLNQANNAEFSFTDYNDIPNNATITLTQNNSKIGSFTTNQSNNASFNFTDTQYTFNLADNSDLNNVTNAGFYRYNTGVVNGPASAGSHGQLLVIRGAADTVAQLVFPYGSSSMYFRTGNWVNNAGGTAHEWATVATEAWVNAKFNVAENYVTKDTFVRCYVKLDENGKPYVDVPVSVSGSSTNVTVTVGTRSITISQSSDSAALSVDSDLTI